MKKFLILLLFTILVFEQNAFAEDQQNLSTDTEITKEQNNIATVLYFLASSIQNSVLENKTGALYPALERDLNLQNPASNEIWNRFLLGAHYYFGAISDTKPVIGFYNPIYDGWLIIHITTKNEKLYIDYARVIDGHIFRAQNEKYVPMKPEWVKHFEKNETGMFKVLFDHAFKAGENFNEKWPLLQKNTKPFDQIDYEHNRQILEGRISYFILNVSDAQKSPLIQSAIEIYSNAVKGDKEAQKSLRGLEGKDIEPEYFKSIHAWAPLIFLGDKEKAGLLMIVSPADTNKLSILDLKKDDDLYLLELDYIAMEEEEQL